MQVLIDFCDPHAGAGASALRCAFDAPLQTLVAHTAEEVQAVLQAIDDLSRQGRWCVGYLRYEAASSFDAALTTHAPNGPLAWFGVYERALPWPEPTSHEVAHIRWQPTLDRATFDANMAKIHQAIAAGEFYQVNYTAPLQGDLIGSPRALFGQLQAAQPGGYAAYIDTGLEQVLSVSPELFFDWQDGRILTRPMKGTAPRGASAAQDLALAQQLQQSPKERAENVMIVDLLRNDLSRIAQPHSVTVPQLFAVQTLPTVLQMVSDVRAQTRPGTTLADVFSALFPCGSITGAPKVRAMQMVRSLEPQARGVYCGAIGVVRPGGHATFNVAIRTVTLQGRRATCGIGSGITADATAHAEWTEWQYKRGFLERASQPFQLLETLHLQGGTFRHLKAHLQRLAQAATHFGYPFDEASLRQCLTQQAASLPSHAQPAADRSWRVRLLLAADGTPTAELSAHTDTPDGVRIGLAATVFEASGSEFTRFKTTHRAHYDAFAPTDPGVFDTLLYNAAHELTECTRGNIALLLDGQWVTPVLHCGLLAGVGRAHWLATGRLREAVVTLDDLPRVQAVAFVNSLRGWLPAKLV